MRTVNGLEELQSLVGQELGVSDWHTVPQAEVDLFAKATHDHQWIHVDPERCKRESPFGGPIAHGYYTIALAPALLAQVLEVKGIRMGVNYGLNKMRLPSPVPVGSRVRLRASLAGYEATPGGGAATIGLSFEVDGQAKPACVAEVIYRYYA
ncbi:MAG: MaoC family dehydratase [Candidatus Binatia bacterium]